MALIHTNKRRGRHTQSKVAKLLGGRNVGTVGNEDVSTINFSIETKSFAKFLGHTILDQAEKNNQRKVTAIGIVHVRGHKYDEAIVLMRLRDFKILIKEVV